GLNLDAAPSAQLLPPESIVWLSDTLARGPDEAERSIAEVTGPGALPESLLSALDGKLALTAGLAEVAYLAQVTYDDGTRSHVLVFIDPVPGAEADLARAMSEALIFSGVPAGQLDVLFLQANQAKSAVFARHGLRIDLPKPDVPVKPIETAPPKLR
ncbi:MAG: SseB family protein, partial [Pseudomonadota bacterium]